MKQEDFKTWLENKYIDTPTTVRNRITNCKNVEKYYGDLDSAYHKDKCKSIIDELNYSTEDERENRAKKHPIPIDGNIRTGSATLKQAVKLYVHFRDEEATSTRIDTISNDLVSDDKHSRLLSILSQFEFKRKEHSDVGFLQNQLTEFLNKKNDSFVWETEYRVNENYKDSIDIIGKSPEFDYVHVIELDTHRADQISKKFVSRMALLENENVCYTAICYPGTKKMSKNEAQKYFNYCSILAKNLSKDCEKSFKGILLQ